MSAETVRAEYFSGTLTGMRTPEPRITGVCSCGVAYDRAARSLNPECCTDCSLAAEGLRVPRAAVEAAKVRAITPRRRA